MRIVNCGHHPPVKLTAGAEGLQIMAPELYVPPLGLHPVPTQDIALKPAGTVLQRKRSRSG